MKPLLAGLSTLIGVVALYICLSPLYVISQAVTTNLILEGAQFSPFVYLTSLVVVGLVYAIGVGIILLNIKRRLFR